MSQQGPQHSIPRQQSLALLPLEPSRGGAGNSSSGSDRVATPSGPGYPPAGPPASPRGGRPTAAPTLWVQEPAAAPAADPLMIGAESPAAGGGSGGRRRIDHMMPMHDIAAQLSHQSGVLDPLLGALSANPTQQARLEAGQSSSGLPDSAQHGPAQHGSGQLGSSTHRSARLPSGQLGSGQQGSGHQGSGHMGMAQAGSGQLDWRQRSGSGSGRLCTPAMRSPGDVQQHMHGMHAPVAPAEQLKSHASLELEALVREHGVMAAQSIAGGEIFVDPQGSGGAFPPPSRDGSGAHAGMAYGANSPPAAGGGVAAGSKFTCALALMQSPSGPRAGTMAIDSSMPRDAPAGHMLGPVLHLDQPRPAEVTHASAPVASTRGGPRGDGHPSGHPPGFGRAEHQPTTGKARGIGRTTSGTVVTAQNVHGPDPKIANVSVLSNARMTFFPSAAGHGAGSSSGDGGEGAAGMDPGGRLGGGERSLQWQGSGDGRPRRSQKRSRRDDEEYMVGEDNDDDGSDEDDEDWGGEGEEGGRRGDGCGRHGGSGAAAARSGSGSEGPQTPAEGKYGGKLSETERKERRRKSNRESARRSRQRRMQEAKECEDRIAALNQNSVQLGRQLEEARHHISSLSAALDRTQSIRDASLTTLTTLLETLITDAQSGMHVSQRLAAAVQEAQQVLRRSQDM
eukprot:jgi/Ulvmu1/2484/UM137_0010.1